VGANPYFYFTPYQADLRQALQALREQEFRAGRYDPAMRMADPPSYMFEFSFPPDSTEPGPGAQHASIEEAMDAGQESGTGSILDLVNISDQPDFSAASPLPSEDLIRIFGTTHPTRDLLQSLLGGQNFRDPGLRFFWEQIDRGQGRYVVLYANSEPSEIFFAGMSWD
jgi:hypothetical protein